MCPSVQLHYDLDENSIILALNVQVSRIALEAKNNVLETEQFYYF